MASTYRRRAKVFVSYSHRDEPWLKRLQVHIKPLIRDGTVEFWDDTLIRPGTDWQDAIENALNSARVAVLFISADFLASDFISTEEPPRLLRNAEEDGAIILSIIISPSRFTSTPSLARFQSVNPPDRPLLKLPTWEQEEIFVAAAEAISQSTGLPRKQRVPRRRARPGSKTTNTSAASATGPASRPKPSKSGKVRRAATDAHTSQAPSAPSTQKEVPDRVKELYNRLTEILGFLKDSDWSKLSAQEKQVFERYLVEQLTADSTLGLEQAVRPGEAGIREVSGRTADSRFNTASRTVRPRSHGPCPLT